MSRNGNKESKKERGWYYAELHNDRCRRHRSHNRPSYADRLSSGGGPGCNLDKLGPGLCSVGVSGCDGDCPPGGATSAEPEPEPGPKPGPGPRPVPESLASPKAGLGGPAGGPVPIPSADEPGPSPDPPFDPTRPSVSVKSVDATRLRMYEFLFEFGATERRPGDDDVVGAPAAAGMITLGWSRKAGWMSWLFGMNAH